MSVHVQGDVDDGWGAVADAFRANFESGEEVGAACAVYVGDRKVVDVWGGLRDPKRGLPWEEDTLVTVFSTTKGMSSLAVALAHSRGLFEYDDLVVEHWPEFGQAGKDHITIRQLLSHQAGLPAIDEPLDLDALADPEAVAAAIAAQEPAWEPGVRHGYHGLSLGFYESELIRRVDPKSRTLGQYFNDEVALPLDVEFYIGVPAQVDRRRIAQIQADWYRLRMLFNLAKLPRAFVAGFLNPRSITARTYANPKVLGKPARYNDEAMRRIELPAANGTGEVRAIAKAYGEFACGGSVLDLDDRTLASLRRAAPDPTEGLYDVVQRESTRFSLGFCKPWPSFDFGSDQAFGTPGAGGSLGFADPETGLGFGYAMNRLDYYPTEDPRQVRLREAAHRCAAA
ncbi:serine hydrolase domain-containing protein [Euzebya tangerina]|uniref:serine hydrolase domain-containing protein n=1 Tax=Euzebya tangerina TaxID=591198 RepID=UPI00196B5D75|nr:serine hydrolase domain-containing protein [Euzebya tangerina]